MSLLPEFDKMVPPSATRGEEASAIPSGGAGTAPIYERGSYLAADRRRMRLGALLLTFAIHALAFGVLFFHWNFSSPPPAAAPTLSVFDVAHPAAPPEPVRETPPGPPQVQKAAPQPRSEMPNFPTPEVEIPTNSPVPAPAPVLDPAPPIKQTTSPENKPAPPAPQSSNARPTWEGAVLAALNKVKRYPGYAQSRRQQGVPLIRFVMDRSGKVLSSRLERSSGVRLLDEEAVALPKRAQPLPKPPAAVGGEAIELVVPVEFFVR